MDKNYANQELYITRGSEIDGMIYYDISSSASGFSINRLKSSSIESGDGWIEWGKACGVWDYREFAKNMKKIYGEGCFEQKNSAEDSNGCRTIYHRPC